MTDFRRVRRLHAHSGGTVPDFDRIVYSPYIPDEMHGTETIDSITDIIEPSTAKVNCRRNFFIGLSTRSCGTGSRNKPHRN